jgi:hypothetical protein
MTNQLHLIVESTQGSDLAILASEFRNFTGRIILEDMRGDLETRKNWILERFEKAGRASRPREKFQVWQPIESEFIDMRTGRFNEKLEFIHRIPVRDRITILPEEYLYSSARDYVGTKGLVNMKVVETGPVEIPRKHSYEII